MNKFFFFASAATLVAAAAVACGVPNLESGTCTEARYALRSYYSVHFDLGISGDRDRDVAARRYMLTDKFAEKLSRDEIEHADPFTLEASIPTTFKIGECAGTDGEAKFRVQIYRRDDLSVMQKDIFVRLRKEGGKWLIDDITAN